MKDKEPIIILIVIFIFVGLAWEPIRNGSFNLTSTSTPPTAASASDISSDPYTYPSDSNTNTSSTIQTDPTHSPYYNKINLSYVDGIYDSDPSKQYISLFTNLDQDQKVDVTGWKLMSERSGNWVKIGTASLLPYPNNASKNFGDVVLAQGDTLNIVKGFSPINASFRNNECTGFFEEDRQFYPYLDRSCPQPYTENLPQFSTDLDRDDECKDIIKQIPGCTTPSNYINLNHLSDTVTQTCKNYLSTHINYNTCVVDHVNDANFAGHTWYIYLNTLGPLWRDQRETITLYDNQGLIVSSISY